MYIRRRTNIYKPEAEQPPAERAAYYIHSLSYFANKRRELECYKLI